MTDAEPRTTSAGGGLLSAFDRAMAGLTEADVAAAFDDDPSESPAPAARPPAGEPAPDRPEPAPHRVVDPRAQEVADRLLGRNPATAADVAVVFHDHRLASPAPAKQPPGPAAEPVPDRPEPAPHRVVDPRAQAVADRLLGRNPATARGRRPIARFETVAGKR